MADIRTERLYVIVNATLALPVMAYATLEEAMDALGKFRANNPEREFSLHTVVLVRRAA